MNWMDIGKQAIQMGAPILGGALGGPAGAAVGAWVAGQFGVADPTPANAAAPFASSDAVLLDGKVEGVVVKRKKVGGEWQYNVRTLTQGMMVVTGDRLGRVAA